MKNKKISPIVSGLVLVGCLVLASLILVSSVNNFTQEASTIKSTKPVAEVPGTGSGGGTGGTGCTANPGLTVTLDPNTPTPTTIVPGQQNIPVLSIKLQTSSCEVRLTSVTVAPVYGTWVPADFQNATLTLGGVAISNPTALSGGVFSINSISTFYGVITPNTTVTMGISASIASGATANHNFKFGLTGSSSVTAISTVNTNLQIVVVLAQFNGNLMTIGLGSPAITTDAATNITTNSAKLNATILNSSFGGNGVGWFKYGTTTAMTLATPQQPLSTMNNLFSQTASNLLPATHYYFSACAKSPTGSPICDGQNNFTTLALQPDLAMTNLLWADIQGQAFGTGAIHKSSNPNDVRFEYFFDNLGPAAVTGNVFTVALYKGSVSAANQVFDFGPSNVSIPSNHTGMSSVVVMGTSTQGPVNLLTLPAGTYTVVFKIDSQNLISELNENNNTYTTQVTLVP